MKVLGVLLAGGKSQRFGSDKALVQYQGKKLIDHAFITLDHQCDDIIISGRRYGDLIYVTDNPDHDQGPLGGINAALCYAQKYDYDAVVSYPCDTICTFANLNEPWFIYNDQAQYMKRQPVIGYWPAILYDSLSQWMMQQKRRSMMAWIETIIAKPSDRDYFYNINTQSDLNTLIDQ